MPYTILNKFVELISFSFSRKELVKSNIVKIKPDVTSQAVEKVRLSFLQSYLLNFQFFFKNRGNLNNRLVGSTDMAFCSFDNTAA